MSDASASPRRLVSGRARRIRRFCGLMSGAALFFVLALPLLAAIHWFLTDPATLAANYLAKPEWLGQFTWTGRLLPFAIFAMPMIVLCWSLWRVRSCFDEFAKGRLFSQRAIAGLRDFAIGMVLGALASPIANTLLHLVLTWNAPEGQRVMVIALSSDTFLGLIFAGIIAIICWVMGEAAEVAEENAQFV